MQKNKNQKIITILGLPGSGKSVVIDYLMNKFNWPKVYFGEIILDEIKKQGLKVNEKNERMIREGMREKYGRLCYANPVIKKINKIKNTTILVESLYDWEEYKLFKKTFKNNFITIAIYTTPSVRYKRLSVRKIRPLSLKEAQSRDYAQIENIFQAGPIAMANYTVNNNSSFEELYQQIDGIVYKVIKLKVKSKINF